VIAHTHDAEVYFESNSASGSSYDNLAPGIAENLFAEQVENSINITWNNVADEDLDFYSLYRDTEINFIPSEMNLITTTTDTTYNDVVDNRESYFYKLSATDYNGNEGLYAETSIELLSNDINPFEFSLEGCYPNPFNPVTTIRFTTPNISNVTIEVYNMNGQLTETLFSGNKSAGQHSIDWYANDNTSGLYLIRMSSGEFVETQKVMLLK